MTPWPQQPQLHVKSCAGLLDHRWERSQPTPSATLPPSRKIHSHLHLQSHRKMKKQLAESSAVQSSDCSQSGCLVEKILIKPSGREYTSLDYCSTETELVGHRSAPSLGSYPPMARSSTSWKDDYFLFL